MYNNQNLISIRLVPNIYIIESTSVKDDNDSRSEGFLLQKTLELFEFVSSYHPVNTKEDFEKALNGIPESKLVDDFDNSICVPVLHISAHGDENGFILKDNSRISWEMFRQYLNPVNKRCLDSLFLVMSVCKGANAINAARCWKNALPFLCVLGSKNDIEWKDALMASLLFYYHFDDIINDSNKVIDTINNSLHLQGDISLLFADTVQKQYKEEMIMKLAKILHNNKRI